MVVLTQGEGVTIIHIIGPPKGAPDFWKLSYLVWTLQGFMRVVFWSYGSIPDGSMSCGCVRKYSESSTADALLRFWRGRSMAPSPVDGVCGVNSTSQRSHERVGNLGKHCNPRP